MVHAKTDNIYKDIAKNFETRFNTSNFELDRPLPKGINKIFSRINERWIRWTNHERIC